MTLIKKAKYKNVIHINTHAPPPSYTALISMAPEKRMIKMETKLALLLMALAIGAAPSAGAQNRINVATPKTYESISLSIDERFDNCLHFENCTAQEHLKLLNDINDSMRESLLRIEQDCALKKFEECSVQPYERARWHKRYNQLGEVMQSLDAAGGMNEQAPSAGSGTNKERKSFWWWRP